MVLTVTNLLTASLDRSCCRGPCQVGLPVLSYTDSVLGCTDDIASSIHTLISIKGKKECWFQIKQEYFLVRSLLQVLDFVVPFLRFVLGNFRAALAHSRQPSKHPDYFWKSLMSLIAICLSDSYTIFAKRVIYKLLYLVIRGIFFLLPAADILDCYLSAYSTWCRKCPSIFYVFCRFYIIAIPFYVISQTMLARHNFAVTEILSCLRDKKNRNVTS